MSVAPAPVQVSDNYSFALMFLKRSYPQVENQRLPAGIESYFEFYLDRKPQPLTSFALVVRHRSLDHTVSAELGPVVFRAIFEFDAKHPAPSFHERRQ